MDNWLLLAWVNLKSPDAVKMCFSSLCINHLSESLFTVLFCMTCYVHFLFRFSIKYAYVLYWILLMMMHGLAWSKLIRNFYYYWWASSHNLYVISGNANQTVSEISLYTSQNYAEGKNKWIDWIVITLYLQQITSPHITHFWPRGQQELLQFPNSQERS